MNGLRYPDEARVFRGIPIALALAIAAFWLPLAALVIWSH